MLNLFRRHVSECPNYGKRMGQKCPRKPPCPIHYEGIGSNGKRIHPAIAPITRTTIADAIERFLTLKTGKAPDILMYQTVFTPPACAFAGS